MAEQVQTCGRHDDASWGKPEVDGVEVQEVPWKVVGQRLIVEVYRFRFFQNLLVIFNWLVRVMCERWRRGCRE
jgi:hypothetical protein